MKVKMNWIGHVVTGEEFMNTMLINPPLVMKGRMESKRTREGQDLMEERMKKWRCWQKTKRNIWFGYQGPANKQKTNDDYEYKVNSAKFSEAEINFKNVKVKFRREIFKILPKNKHEM